MADSKAHQYWQSAEKRYGGLDDRDWNHLFELGMKDDPFWALEAAKNLHDLDKIRQAALRSEELGRMRDAILAYRYHLHDVVAARRAIVEVLKKEKGTYADIEDLKVFLKENFLERFHTKLLGWISQSGFEDAGKGGPVFEVANAAHTFSKDYDLGIAVAKSGLKSGYLFHLFGLPVKVVETHREEKNLVEVHTPISDEEIAGKRVLIIEYDVSSGETARRLLDFVNKKRPLNCDLFVVDAFHTQKNNIPKGYGKLIHSGLCDFSKWEEVAGILNEKMEK